MAKLLNLNTKKPYHIHIVGISGQGMTTPIALALKAKGHRLTGSDQEKIYPPASNLLKQAKIQINQQKITPKIDLAIIGSGYAKFANTQQEFTHIKRQKINYISATNFVAKYIVRPNSIVVAGAFGKTTTTGLVAWILSKAGWRPNYLIGGKMVNRLNSVCMDNSSDWSVVEGDESINGLDTQAKFLYYPHTHLIITNTYLEHQESYANHQQLLQAFKKLIQTMPSSGILVYNPQDHDLVSLVKFCPGRAIAYDYQLQFNAKLIGQHNYENIIAAYTLTKNLGIPETVIKKAISSYRGINRRLEIVANPKNIWFIDDFAQSPPRIQMAIQAVKQTLSPDRIIVFYEPHASFVNYPQILPLLKQAFAQADQVVMSRLSHTKNSPHRLTFVDFRQVLGSKISYQPIPDQLEKTIISQLKKNTALIHMSSGGKQGIISFRKIITFIKLK